MKKDVYAHNLTVLKKRMPLLLKAVEELDGFGYEYVVEPSKSGAMTLTAKKDGHTTQIHSKYDPIKEAAQQLESLKLINPKLLIILGLGLGYHIRECLKKLDTNFVVVIEKDITAFKTAIENVDLTDLFNSDKIKWVVGVPESEGYAVSYKLIKTSNIGMQLFLKTLQVFNHPAIDKINGSYHMNMLKAFREAAHSIILNYGTCPHDSLIGVENIMKNLSTIMKNPGVKDLYGVFKKVPGVIVSSGPSLDKNIELIKELYDKAVIIAADSSLKPLMSHNIKPHAAASLERVLEITEMLKELPADYKKDIYLAATPVIRKESYDTWNGPTFMVYRSFAHFDWLNMPKGTLNIGSSCSNLAFKVLEAIGCDPIILVGQDCSFVSAEITHAANTPDVSQFKEKEANLIKVKGNYQPFVVTNNIYDMFRKTFVTDLLTYKGVCINATEGGAYIDGTVLMSLREAIDKYCTKTYDIMGMIKKHLHYPTEHEIYTEWARFKKTMIETKKEVEGVIDYCDKGVEMVKSFEKRLSDGGYSEIEDFLERFPDAELDPVVNEMALARTKIITFGKYFQLYLMHIVQMIIIRFEMNFNELQSICQNKKRCKLQAIKLMKEWFPTIGDVCRISLKLLTDAYDELVNEYDNQNAKNECGQDR